MTAGSDPEAMKRRAAVIFDRDGVLNVDHGYAYDPAALEWTPSAREAVKAANDAGVLALVVTNPVSYTHLTLPTIYSV